MSLFDNCYALTVNPVIEVVANTDKVRSNILNIHNRNMIEEPFDIRKPRFKFQEETEKVQADEGLEKTVKKTNNKDEEPSPIFWGNVDGYNYLTWPKNQHIPVSDFMRPH